MGIGYILWLLVWNLGEVIFVLCSVICRHSVCYLFLFQAEDGIRYLVRSRGLGDVYKRHAVAWPWMSTSRAEPAILQLPVSPASMPCRRRPRDCLLYTSDAADERSRVDLGGRRNIKKKKTNAILKIVHSLINIPTRSHKYQRPIKITTLKTLKTTI